MGGRPLEHSGLEEELETFYRDAAGLESGQPVVLAVSGGIDSMVLAHASLSIAGSSGLKFHLAHFDHGIRPNSSADAEFVRGYALRAGIPFHPGAEDVPGFARDNGIGLEEAARLLRYRYLETVRQEVGARFVAVGHNRDDQAETVLLRLIRGSGLRGLRAMRAVGERIIRPLLAISREDIERYQVAAGFEYRDDPTNSRPVADRNRIRLNVMPVLRDIRPGVESVLARTAGTLESDNEVLQWAAGEALRQCDPQDLQGALEITRAPLAEFPGSVVRAVLRRIAETRSGEFPRRADVDAAVSFCLDSRSGGSIRLGRSLWIMRSGERLLFAPAPDWQATPGEEVPLVIPGQVDLPGVGAVLIARAIDGPAAARRAAAVIGGEVDPAAATATLDRDRLGAPLTVRGGLPGDVFAPFGHNDSTTLTEFLVRRRVPAWRRRLTPLVVAGGRVAWVAGVEIGDFCRVRPGSLRLLELRLEYGGEPT